MIKLILDKIFYNPHKIIKKYNKSIMLGKNVIILKSCRFRFDDYSETIKINIDDYSMIGCNFIFESNRGKVQIGNNTFINGGTNLICREEIIIGNNVTIAWGCTIYDHNSHSLLWKDRREDFKNQTDAYKKKKPYSYGKNWNTVKSKKIIIEDDVWIGFDCTILNGVKIGKGAVIGAKSVVREDVKPYTVVVGNPARKVKELDK
jgi:galactoside O-acetyltransferase